MNFIVYSHFIIYRSRLNDVVVIIVFMFIYFICCLIWEIFKLNKFINTGCYLYFLINWRVYWTIFIRSYSHLIIVVDGFTYHKIVLIQRDNYWRERKISIKEINNHNKIRILLNYLYHIILQFMIMLN